MPWFRCVIERLKTDPVGFQPGGNLKPEAGGENLDSP